MDLDRPEDAGPPGFFQRILKAKLAKKSCSRRKTALGNCLWLPGQRQKGRFPEAFVSEKRKFQRVNPDKFKPVEVQVMGKGFLDVLQAKNISEGGMRIIVPHLFEGCDIDSEVELIITLPDVHSFSAKGEIKHKHEDREMGAFGLRFTEIAPEDKKKVVDYVHMRMSEGGAA